MLKKTFCHVRGITLEMEKMLWAHGIHNWDLFMAKSSQVPFLPQNQVESMIDELRQSQEAYEKKNLNFFKNSLHSKEHWRLCDLGKIAFVDIETTGLSRWNHDITLLGIYDGETPFTYIKGKNLHEAEKKLREFDVLVTFNGKQFDLPFIEAEFNCQFDVVHLDLRYMLRELGLQGGLKKIEKILGLTRDEEISQIDGFEAVRLWNRYQRGDELALEKLIKYNQDDIVNLKFLLEYYLNSKQKLQSV